MTQTMPVIIRNGCPSYKSDAYQIYFRVNHGEEWLLEIHYNQYSWAIDGGEQETQEEILNLITQKILKDIKFLYP